MGAGNQQEAAEMTTAEFTKADAEQYVREQAEKIQNGEARYNDFILSIASKLKKFGELTDNQANAVIKGMKRDAERAAENANAEDVPTGKGIQIRGEIVSVKFKDGQFPGMKMTVKDERGFKVWGSLPSKVEDQAELMWGSADQAKGLMIEFTAEVQPSDNDPKFGFVKRPKDVTILNADTHTPPYSA